MNRETLWKIFQCGISGDAVKANALIETVLLSFNAQPITFRPFSTVKLKPGETCSPIIGFIKLLRAEFGLSLREAKAVADSCHLPVKYQSTDIIAFLNEHDLI